MLKPLSSFSLLFDGLSAFILLKFLAVCANLFVTCIFEIELPRLIFSSIGDKSLLTASLYFYLLSDEVVTLEPVLSLLFITVPLNTFTLLTWLTSKLISLP
jgi:hypothetical protein